MNELSEEIQLTINLMQTDIDDGAHEVLHSHLYKLLEIKRNVLQQSLAEPDNPLTVEELKAGGWRCKDVSAECARVFESKSLQVFNSAEWGAGPFKYCVMDYEGVITRAFSEPTEGKQIHRIGNDFYWSEK